jgi:hypothetical protein
MAVPPVLSGLRHPERSQRERTRREDRHFKFYEIPDNLRLHRDLVNLVCFQPVAQRKQTLHRRVKLGDVLDATAAVARRAHARHHARVVDIQRRRALDDHLHPALPSHRCRRRPDARSLDSRSTL